MSSPASARRAPPDTRTLELDVELAQRIYGFRWVRWLQGESPDAPRDSAGRFLARADDPLAHLQAAAPLSLHLAPQPYRHLPRYSLDERLALTACERVGLFRHGGITLGAETDGTWTLRLPRDDRSFRDATLPALLARAALAWHQRSAPSRKGLP